MKKRSNPTAIILPVDKKGQSLTKRARVQFLSSYARLAVTLSAKKSGFHLNHFPKDDNGAPLPANGLYWALTHKPLYVAAVAAIEPIGIDIEKIRDCSPQLLKKIADKAECQLYEAPRLKKFFRFWTAKEAVLKANGAGLGALAKCRIAGIEDSRHMLLTFEGQKWLAEHYYFDHHIACFAAKRLTVSWHLWPDALPLCPESAPAL